MYLTFPVAVIWAIIVLVLCALLCVGVLIRKARGDSLRLSSFEEGLNDAEALITRQSGTIAGQEREIAIKQKAINDLQERIKGLEDSLAARNAECSRLQRLVEKCEKDKKDACEERDKQTNRANDENISRSNAETALFAARHGEDPETESFYRDHMDLLTPAPAEPAADAAAEHAAEEVAPAEAEKKPQKVKKPKTKG